MRKLLVLLFVVAACSGVEPDAVEVAPVEAVEEVPTTVIDGEVWEGTLRDLAPLPEAIRPEPPGFPVADEFTSHAEACLAVVMREVPTRWQRAVLDWCHHRSFAASRNGVVVSKVDGSQIHDRDRPTAWRFWEKQVRRGVLTPETCPFHAVNRKLKHTRNCVKLRRHWDFKDTGLSEKTKSAWAAHPHDVEKFGARGPHDNNANAYNHIGGCWDPAQLDRFDVSIAVTVRASMKICERHGCRTKWDLKEHWGRIK